MLMAIIFVLSGAILCTFSNLFLRRSIDAGGTGKAFLIIQQLLSIVVAIMLNPVRTGHYTWDTSIAMIGIVAGIILGLMMWSLGRALEKGPPGLTIAILNASSVVPAIVMVLLFGFAFGHEYHSWNAIGSILVIIGLFWAAYQHSSMGSFNKFSWLLFALSAFCLHVFFLVIIEWRALLITPELPTTRLLPFLLESSQTQWFMPMIFLASTVLLTTMFWLQDRRYPNITETVYGIFGGVCYGACTFFLIQAAVVANAWESAMIFPIFSVVLVVGCNIWGILLYKEKVNWKANTICLAGLFIGTMNWSRLAI